jgi:hypothetical protein
MSIEHPVMVKGEHVEVTASMPAEMVQCQSALIDWCAGKVRSVREEITELAAAVERAVSAQWDSRALKRQLERAKKQIIYYGKVMSALKHGYCIVPNFPISFFAIRTAAASPAGSNTFEHWATFEQKPGQLEEGQGTYKNPFPVIYQREVEAMQGDKLVKKKEYFPEMWGDVEFPVSMAKPQIMDAAAAAMKLNLFDAFGICPPRRRADPMIIGQVIDRSRGRFSERVTSFLIAWHLDTRVL